MALGACALRAETVFDRLNSASLDCSGSAAPYEKHTSHRGWSCGLSWGGNEAERHYAEWEWWRMPALIKSADGPVGLGLYFHFTCHEITGMP